MLNVLSIDWDYFFDITGEQRFSLFPHHANEALNEEGKRFVWALMYVQNNDLVKVKVDPIAYRMVNEIKDVLGFFVAESHACAYYYIKGFMEERGEDCVNLLNIDYHHDCVGINEGLPDLHCGNWLKRLMDEVDGSYVWLGREDSDKCENERKLKFISNYNSANIATTLWDMVFICRSDLWSPPHLDTEFTKIFKPLVETEYEYCYYREVQDGIWEDRYPGLADKIEEARKIVKIENNKIRS